jgi:Fe-S cluster biogenesis protein NfuA
MSIEDRVLQALEKIRPYLKEDGGDISLVEVDLPVVRVKLHGACETCNMSYMTMKAGVEEVIKRSIPEIESVETVND